jgi:hypothetical protein
MMIDDIPHTIGDEFADMPELRGTVRRLTDMYAKIADEGVGTADMLLGSVYALLLLAGVHAGGQPAGIKWIRAVLNKVDRNERLAGKRRRSSTSMLLDAR